MSRMSNADSTTVTSSDPAHPRRLEKKKNNYLPSALRRTNRLSVPDSISSRFAALRLAITTLLRRQLQGVCPMEGSERAT